MKIKYILVPLIICLLGSLSGWYLISNDMEPISRNIVIKARQYSYIPSKIEVNKGDTLHIKLISLDVTHGFYLEGFDIDAEINANIKTFRFRHPSEGYNWKDTNEILLIVNKTGKYRYRCSHTCGTMHPFMQGEMIVKPNNLLHAGIGGVIGFTIGMFITFFLKSKNKKDNVNV